VVADRAVAAKSTGAIIGRLIFGVLMGDAGTTNKGTVGRVMVGEDDVVVLILLRPPDAQARPYKKAKLRWALLGSDLWWRGNLTASSNDGKERGSWLDVLMPVY
jgi:hypothetical protein